MAKGRRLTTSRSEWFLGSYKYGHSQGDTVIDETELREEDVWSMVDNVTDRDDQSSISNSQREWSPRAESENNETRNLEMRGDRRQIPRGDRHVSGLSLAFEGSSTTKPRIMHQYSGHDSEAAADLPRGQCTATSVPLNVSDWSKIYRVGSVESMHDSEGGESDMMPTHEYLAREYARSKKSGGASVFEGVGRTLKVRDMRRVRDAVWSQTGYYG